MDPTSGIAPPEPQDLLHLPTGVPAVEDAYGTLRVVPDDGVGGLRAHRPELTIGDDEETRRGHVHGSAALALRAVSASTAAPTKTLSSAA